MFERTLFDLFAKIVAALYAAALVFPVAVTPAEASAGSSPESLGVIGLLAGVAVVTVVLKKMMR